MRRRGETPLLLWLREEITMSVTPLSSDVGAPLTQGKPIARVEWKDGNSGKLGFQKTVDNKEVSEEKKKEEANQPKAEKPTINLLDSGLEFSVDQETGLTVIKMYDRANGKMVRQLPPEETLNFLRKLAEQEDKKGILVSRKL
jgi:flagellar protein FlaG